MRSVRPACRRSSPGKQYTCRKRSALVTCRQRRKARQRITSSRSVCAVQERMTMRDNAAGKSIRLIDYRPPAFLVDTVDLDVDIHDGLTRVTATLSMRRNPAREDRQADCVLDGEALRLLSVELDRSEERRVGKASRSQWLARQTKNDEREPGGWRGDKE